MQWIFLLVGVILACYLVWLLGKLLWLDRLKQRWRSARVPRSTMHRTIKSNNKRPGRARNKTE
ncbi:Uncharacterised protein [Pragia fontium]|uniref:High mobility group protein Z n=1 Tax=Pragia fontium DSM 5563 = ATCC 49100 TaxID=1122977 RepID=A0AAJ4WDA2_9GAMM|nr:hypothetical protein [Pragia fontium]SFD39408.1 hypothetical protein SAMN02745723_11616 [Pragia fontium DSM 5563 = ATCC 49100]SUB80936.1 Uncharacterised protein [Pragia fontium]VEJ52749.1 Uncharacterised protein [Pragia fontium]